MFVTRNILVAFAMCVFYSFFPEIGSRGFQQALIIRKNTWCVTMSWHVGPLSIVPKNKILRYHRISLICFGSRCMWSDIIGYGRIFAVDIAELMKSMKSMRSAESVPWNKWILWFPCIHGFRGICKIHGCYAITESMASMGSYKFSESADYKDVSVQG